MPVEWFQGLEDTKSFEAYCYNNSKDLILRQLVKIIKRRIDEIEKREDDFDVPGWDVYCAANLGRKRELKDLLNLLYFVDHK